MAACEICRQKLESFFMNNILLSLPHYRDGTITKFYIMRILPNENYNLKMACKPGIRNTPFSLTFQVFWSHYYVAINHFI